MGRPVLLVLLLACLIGGALSGDSGAVSPRLYGGKKWNRMYRIQMDILTINNNFCHGNSTSLGDQVFGHPTAYATYEAATRNVLGTLAIDNIQVKCQRDPENRFKRIRVVVLTQKMHLLLADQATKYLLQTGYESIIALVQRNLSPYDQDWQPCPLYYLNRAFDNVCLRNPPLAAVTSGQVQPCYYEGKGSWVKGTEMLIRTPQCGSQAANINTCPATCAEPCRLCNPAVPFAGCTTVASDGSVCQTQEGMGICKSGICQTTCPGVLCPTCQSCGPDSGLVCKNDDTVSCVLPNQQLGYCLAGQCKGCRTDADCTTDPLRRRCDLRTWTCVGCFTDPDCAGDPRGPKCDLNTNQCRPCLTDPDCTTDPNRRCDLNKGLCVECYQNSHCSTAKPTCDLANSVCVAAAAPAASPPPASPPPANPPAAPECSTDADCSSKPTKPKCKSGVCSPECTSNSDCTSVTGKPKCDTTQGICVPECTKDADCTAAGNGCDTATGKCKWMCSLAYYEKTNGAITIQAKRTGGQYTSGTQVTDREACCNACLNNGQCYAYIWTQGSLCQLYTFEIECAGGWTDGSSNPTLWIKKGSSGTSADGWAPGGTSIKQSICAKNTCMYGSQELVCTPPSGEPCTWYDYWTPSGAGAGSYTKCT